VFGRPEGVKIGACFIAAVVVTSFPSRALRSTELRVSAVELDAGAERLLLDLDRTSDLIRIVANHPDRCDDLEYEHEGRQKLESHHLTAETPIAFPEVAVTDASEFSAVVRVRGYTVAGHRVFSAEGAAVPNAVAAFLLEVRKGRARSRTCTSAGRKATRFSISSSTWRSGRAKPHR